MLYWKVLVLIGCTRRKMELDAAKEAGRPEVIRPNVGRTRYEVRIIDTAIECL
jgi:hypothetical protein